LSQPRAAGDVGCYTALMKLVVPALLIALAANTAALAQYVLDAKGRRSQCLPGDWSCIVPPPPGAPVTPLPRPRPPPQLPGGPGEDTETANRVPPASTVGDCEVRPSHFILEKSRYGAPGCMRDRDLHRTRVRSTSEDAGLQKLARDQTRGLRLPEPHRDIKAFRDQIT
jgi:hypothetical protein